MKIQHLKHCIVFGGLIAAAYFGEFGNVRWCHNLMVGVTALSAFTYTVLANSSKRTTADERLRDSYKNGEHLPRWMDALGYTAILCLYAASAHYWLMAGWSLVAAGDFMLRDKATQPKP